MTFREKYGPWGVVAGASEGLGQAFGEAMARRGLNVLLLARRKGALAAVAKSIRTAHGVEVETLSVDLATPTFAAELAGAIAGKEIGLGVYNAGYSFIGNTLSRPLDASLRVVDVNCAGPLRFVHALAPAMVSRGRGGIVLLSSIAGFQGSPRLAPYAASKAFNLVLAEGLWAELAPAGVDLIASCPGATRTPNYLKTTKTEAPGTLDAREVVETTLHALGSGPMVIPGAVNKVASFVLSRLMPRKTAVRIMHKSTRDLSE